jgi:hypothetical protein
MNVELEQVEELVRYEVNGAIDVFFNAKVEFEGTSGFVADWEGYVLKLARCVDNLGVLLVHRWEGSERCDRGRYSHVHPCLYDLG